MSEYHWPHCNNCIDTPPFLPRADDRSGSSLRNADHNMKTKYSQELVRCTLCRWVLGDVADVKLEDEGPKLLCSVTRGSIYI
jgi:hypothetical protein